MIFLPETIKIPFYICNRINEMNLQKLILKEFDMINLYFLVICFWIRSELIIYRRSIIMKNIGDYKPKQRTKAVFLDRDGVLNEIKSSRVDFVNTPQDLYLLPGTADAIARIREKGYLIFIVTNQAGVSLGYMNHTQLNNIHKHLEKELKKVNANAIINEVVACTHNIKENCNCRKPNAGMLITLAEKYNISLVDSYMIGDRESDIEAGIKAGTKTIHISQQIIETKADKQYSTLLEASSHII